MLSQYLIPGFRENLFIDYQINTQKIQGFSRNEDSRISGFKNCTQAHTTADNLLGFSVEFRSISTHDKSGFFSIQLLQFIPPHFCCDVKGNLDCAKPNLLNNNEPILTLRLNENVLFKLRNIFLNQTYIQTEWQNKNQWILYW